MEETPKKRSRILTSCSVCRKRKSRCDRQRPVCGPCKKKSVAHLCKYEDEFDMSSPYSSLGTMPAMPAISGNSAYVAHPQMMPLGPHNIQALPNGHIPSINSSISPTLNGNLIHYAGNNGNPVPHSGNNGMSLGPISAAPMVPMYQQWPNQVPDMAFQGQFSPVHFVNKLNTPTPGPPPPMPPQFLRSHSHYSSGAYPGPHSASSAAMAPRVHGPPSSIGGESANEESLRSNSLRSNHNRSESTGSTSSTSTPYNKDTNKHGSSLVQDIPMDNTNIKAKLSQDDSYAMHPPPLPDSNSNISSPMDGGSLRRAQAPAISPTKSETYQSSAKDSHSQMIADEYAEPGFVSVSIGQNILRIAVDDTMSSFAVASSTLLVDGPLWQQQGPLSYVGMTKRDSFTKLVRNFTMDLFKSEQFQQFVSKPKDEDKNGGSSHASGSPKIFDQPMSTEEAKIEQDSEQTFMNDDMLVTTKIKAFANEAQPSDEGPDGGLNPINKVQSILALQDCKSVYYEFVASNVIKILPSKSAVYMAVNKFFHYVHPFVHIFHEETVLKEFKNLFKGDYLEKNEGYYESITIRNDADLTIVGALLIMIQLGYMTLIPNNEVEMHYTDLEVTLIKDISRFKSDQRISVINSCLSEEKVKIMTTFKSVQCLTLLFFFRSVLPNDCLGLSGSDSQLLFGAIVNQALSIGLNRDPLKYDTINSISKKPDFVNTWRSLWNFIVNADANNSIYCGTPMKLQNLDNSDVEPSASFSEEVSAFNLKVDAISACYRSIVTKVTNLRKQLRVIDLLSETSKLEKIFLKCFGKDFFRDYISSPAPKEPTNPHKAAEFEETFMKVRRFLLFINTRANLSCLYYLVVLHYEQKLDEDKDAEIGAGIELFKIFIRSVVQLVYIMSYALDNAEELFGRHYDFILTSRIERSMIKTHIFVTSFFIRLINYKRTLAIKEMEGGGSDDIENFEERCEVVDSLFTIALIEAELFVGHFKSLSNTYINSYKLYVIAFFVLKQCMENPELLLAGFTNKKSSFFHNGTNMLQFMSNPELQSMCKLCEEFRLAKLESIRRQKNHRRPEEKSEAMQSISAADMNTNTELENEDFNAAAANRAMYGNDNTVNTYGWVKEKQARDGYHEIFDEQSMVGNDELLKLFELYGYLEN